MSIKRKKARFQEDQRRSGHSDLANHISYQTNSLFNSKTRTNIKIFMKNTIYSETNFDWMQEFRRLSKKFL